MQASHDLEPVNVSEILGLASWDRERSDEELKSFIDRHDAAIEGFEEELFEV